MNGTQSRRTRRLLLKAIRELLWPRRELETISSSTENRLCHSLKSNIRQAEPSERVRLQGPLTLDALVTRQLPTSGLLDLRVLFDKH